MPQMMRNDGNERRVRDREKRVFSTRFEKEDGVKLMSDKVLAIIMEKL